jgi:hypothetical protein
MMLTAHPFVGCMIDRTVLAAEPRKFSIGFQFVGRYRRAFLDILDNLVGRNWPTKGLFRQSQREKRADIPPNG